MKTRKTQLNTELSRIFGKKLNHVRRVLDGKMYNTLLRFPQFSAKSFWRWENESCLPSVDIIYQLAYGFDIDIAHFLDFTNTDLYHPLLVSNFKHIEDKNLMRLLVEKK